MTPRDLLVSTATSWQLALTPRQLDQFDIYAAELARWNTHTNLTTITAPEAIVTRHFLDSLALARVWSDQPPQSLADIGTGAGFPGVPLKILWPELRLVLIESVGKKAAFLAHLATTLELTHVEVTTARAEAVGHEPRFREHFDGVTARAVAPLRVLAEYCLPLCRVGGVVVAPKSADGTDEAQAAQPAITQLGGAPADVLPIQIPTIEPRTVVVIRKVAPTPSTYPRRTGVPSKRPL